MLTTGKCPFNEYCESKTDMGYCGRTGGCSKNFFSIKTVTTEPQIERICIICGDAFSFGLSSNNIICPECQKRLKRVLYPEK